MTRIRLRIDFNGENYIGQHGPVATAAQAKKHYRQLRSSQGDR